MSGQPDDSLLLEKYKTDLVGVRERLDELRAEARPLVDDEKDLEQLIELIERRIARRGGIEPPPPPPVEPDGGRDADAPARAKRQPGGMKAIMRELMPPGSTWTRESAHDLLSNDPRYAARAPSVNSVGNRMNELVHEGFLARRGSLFDVVGASTDDELAPSRGDENPAEPGGPNLGAQLDGEKPPVGQLISVRPGHPNNSEGATGVVHRPGL